MAPFVRIQISNRRFDHPMVVEPSEVTPICYSSNVIFLTELQINTEDRNISVDKTKHRKRNGFLWNFESFSSGGFSSN